MYQSGKLNDVKPSVETMLDDLKAINKINTVSGKEECAKAHFEALPEKIIKKLSEEQVDLIKSFRALVLEWLPLKKRQKIESAVRDNLLGRQKISGTNKTLVLEKPSRSLMGLLTSTPEIKIEDFFPK